MDIFMESIMKKYGDIVRIKVPGSNILLLSNPEHFHYLSQKESRIPVMPLYEFFDYIRGERLADKFPTKGLITNSEDWYTTRKAIQKIMMRPNSALHYVSDTEKIALELIRKFEDKMDNNGNVEVKEFLQQYAFDAISFMFIGKNIGALKETEESKEMMNNLDLILNTWSEMMFLPIWLAKYHPKTNKIVKAIGDTHGAIQKHVEKKLKNLEKDDNTVIANLVKTCGTDSSIPTVFAIEALQAGSETTGLQSTFLLYHVARNEEVQEKLYKEICDTIGPDGHLTEAALGKMSYVKACQTEAMRINPVALGSTRILDRDIEVGGYMIPAGTNLIRCGSTAQMDPRNFSSPGEFRPERWLRGHEERHESNSYAYIPFGHGVRSCIGQRFAKLEMYVLIVKLIQKYKMKNVSGDVGTRTRVTVEPDRPVVISFQKR